MGQKYANFYSIDGTGGFGGRGEWGVRRKGWGVGGAKGRGGGGSVNIEPAICKSNLGTALEESQWRARSSIHGVRGRWSKTSN